MLQLPAIVSDAIYHIQQLVYQPASRRTAVASTTLGFTIVELLIVIVVIGILAAIVIVAFNGIQNNAYNTTVQSNLASVAKVIETEKIKNSGNYPANLTPEMGIRINKDAYDKGTNDQGNNLYYCTDSATNRYAFTARSKTMQQYKIIDGVVSTHATSLSGQSTCNLLGLSPNPTWGSAGANTLGYGGTSTPQWRTWTN